MSMQMGQGSPIQQDSTNYAGAGLNMFNTLLAGDSRYNDIRLQQAQQQAGGLAAAGDYDAARNSMLAQGYPGQAVQYQGLANAAKTRKDEAQEADENDQAGALLAQGNHQAAAALLYKAGRFEDAQNILKHAQTSQVTGLTQQASTFAARGEWAKATEAAYRSGDLKAAGFYQDKAQEMQKSQTYQEIARTQAISKAVASAKSQEDYDRLHDSFEAAGYPKEVVAKYRNFADRDKHMLELDAHKEDLTGRLAPEDREKVEKADPIGTHATRMSDPGYRAMIKKIGLGQMATSDVPGFRGERERVMQDVMLEHPDYDPVEAKNAQKAWDKYTLITGPSSPAAKIGAADRFSAHLGSLADAVDNLHNTSLPWWNVAANATQNRLGADARDTFHTNVQGVSGEIDNLIATGQSTEGEKKEWRKNLEDAASPAQHYAILLKMAELGSAQFRENDKQYLEAAGKYARPHKFLSDESREAINRVVYRWTQTHPGEELPAWVRKAGFEPGMPPKSVTPEQRTGPVKAPPLAPATPRPSGRTDDQLRAGAQQAIAAGASPADIEMQLKSWGVVP
jgi:hypothetical protein